jgi:glutaconyl-CoA/methylmalonyl-CoA decarboxylase subunit delta
MDLTADPLMLGLQIAATGVTVVFVALTIVALALSALRAIDEPLARLHASRTAAARQPAQLTEVPADQLTPVLVAVLAAAAAEMLDQPVRVTRVRYYGRQPAGSWSRQGRLAVMASRQRRG